MIQKHRIIFSLCSLRCSALSSSKAPYYATPGHVTTIIVLRTLTPVSSHSLTPRTLLSTFRDFICVYIHVYVYIYIVYIEFMHEISAWITYTLNNSNCSLVYREVQTSGRTPTHWQTRDAVGSPLPKGNDSYHISRHAPIYSSLLKLLQHFFRIFFFSTPNETEGI